MNYVLFFPDEMRSESLGCYGHPIVRTPNIDRMAREGTLFEQNYTQHPVCMASRCALLTGWYPHVHGHRTLKYDLTEHEPNFFRALKEAGYTVGLYGKNHVFTKEAFEKSISEHSPVTFGHIGSKQPDGRTLTNPDPKGENGKREVPVPDDEQCRMNYTLMTGPMPEGQGEVAGNETTADPGNIQAGIEFIRRHAHEDSPFFLFLPLGNPHPPYTVPQSLYDMYDPGKVPMRDMSWLEGKPKLYEAYRRFHEAEGLDEEVFRKVNAVYLGMVTYTDAMLGQVLEELEKQGIYDDTTIIVCSDHGDWAGECRLVEKWPNAMDEMLLRVPLIIRRPGCKGGQRVKTLTQSIDIFPTVFDLEGLKIGWDQFGVSLKPQLEGEPGDENRVVYSEGGYDVREPHCFEGTPAYAPLMVKGNRYYPKMLQQQEEPETVARSVMRRDGRFKYVFRFDGDNELYDMQEDPQEYHNLWKDPAYETVRSRLTEETLRWLLDCSDVVPREGH